MTCEEWDDVWHRVQCLDQLGQRWVFEGQMAGVERRFIGPLVGGSVFRINLYEDGELVHEVSWAPNRAMPEPWVFDTQGPLLSEVRGADMVRAMAGEDFNRRRGEVKQAWAKLVTFWKEYGMEPGTRWAYGVTMNGPGVLYVDGVDERGEVVVTVSCAPMDEVRVEWHGGWERAMMMPVSLAEDYADWDSVGTRCIGCDTRHASRQAFRTHLIWCPTYAERTAQ